MLGFVTQGIKIPPKKILSLIILFAFNLSSMYFYHLFLMDELLKLFFNQWETIFFGKSLFYISLSISQLLGAMIADKVNRKTLLQYWILFGVATLILTIVFQDMNTIFYFCILLGLSYGIGLPSCFAALADLTLIEERGRISGLVQFSTFLSLVLLVLVPSMLSFGVREYQILSLILRILSFAALLLEPFYRISGKGISFPKILRKREFLFYTIPWLMFNLSNGVLEIINSIFRPNPAYKIVFELSPFVLYLGALIFGLISGIIADRSGRKQPIILGFIVLGISYALIGITSTPQSWFTMIALSGVGWGFIMVVYLWTILGDIAPIGGREKFYAIGFVIPTLTETIFEFVANKIYLDVNISYVSTVLSIFLFLSVFPLILAKETLPEEKMSDRRLRDYLIKARERLRESEEKS